MCGFRAKGRSCVLGFRELRLQTIVEIAQKPLQLLLSFRTRVFKGLRVRLGERMPLNPTPFTAFYIQIHSS